MVVARAARRRHGPGTVQAWGGDELLRPARTALRGLIRVKFRAARGEERLKEGKGQEDLAKYWIVLGST
ncbi:hypothetical protein Ssi02_49860 [Sinosporangium siamense]|uniref:Uncharacterized protein n=1 Tax=Sinosporangium siamense TaxID=1367973 RepID=A0A919V753_9ACTN|nr:hypothetical protein Ssi02_49860 [Sinosporangium siamense]